VTNAGLRRAVIAACVLGLVVACAEVERAHNPDGSSSGTTWTLGVSAWLAAIGNWMWSVITSMFGGGGQPPIDLLGVVTGFITGHPLWTGLIGNAAAALLPGKVQDNVVAALQPSSGATIGQRVQALAAATPAALVVRSPPATHARTARRIAMKKKRKPKPY
jgi:hypothetical protein